MNLLKNAIQLRYYALLLTLCLLPLFNGGFDHPSLYYALGGLSLILAAFFWQTKQKLSLRAILIHPVFYYVLFCIWAMLSGFWSLDSHRSLTEFLQLALFLAVYLIALSLPQNKIQGTLDILMILGGGLALLAFIQLMSNGPARVSSAFDNPNPFATFMGMLVLLSWGKFLEKRTFLFLPLTVLLLSTVFLSGSRGALIFLLPFLVLATFILRLKRLKTGKKVLFFSLLIVFALLLSLTALRVSGSFNQIPETSLAAHTLRTETLGQSTGGRFAFWLTALETWQNQPLNGYGLGTTFLTHGLGSQTSPFYSRFTHNHYLQVLLETGLIGLALFGAFLVLSLKRLFQILLDKNTRGQRLSIAMACLFFLAHIFIEFSWNFTAVPVLFFFLLGVLLKRDAPCVSLPKASPEQSRRIFQLLSVFFLLIFILNLWQFSAFAFYSRAVKLVHQGRLSEASRIYEQANSIYPINPMAYAVNSDNYLRKFYLSEGADTAIFEAAFSNAKKAVELCPVKPSFQKKLAILYEQMNDSAKAEEHYILALNYGAYTLDTYLSLGSFYARTEDFEQAEKYLLQGLARGKEDNLILFSEEDLDASRLGINLALANVYKLTGKEELSRVHLEESMKILERRPELIER